jgi:Cof subfamily protein (haloacid dehalogenase superfamily)
MIRLVCIDVDGTLLGSNGDVHPAVWPAAERARAAGIHLALCTGRPALGLTGGYAARLDPEGWHIFQNGASVVHLPTGRALSVRLPGDSARMLTGRARRIGRILELYSDSEYVVEDASERARVHAALLGIEFTPGRLESLYDTAVRAQWLLAPAEKAAVLAESYPGLEVSPSLTPAMPDTLFVNLTVAGVNKATALQTMLRETGVPLEQVMFVGDGANDAEAMGLVGWPVAMANAEPEARAVARHFAGHVDEGGLAEALDAAIRSA